MRVLFALSRAILLVCLGATLISGPWGALWRQNVLLAHHVLALAVGQNYFLRGAISGLGLTNFWLAMDEIRQIGVGPRSVP